MERWSRRKFFQASVAGSAAASVGKLFGRALPGESSASSLTASGLGNAVAAQGARPIIISSANGINALGRGMDILKKGGDTLDAVVAAVSVVEDDPNDDSVGYGGLPNEDGEVELDASVMHGPTRRGGSVAAVRRIKNVARLAKTVMERTNHVMLVGPGATRFGVAQGFEEMNLLTERSRLAWLAWKASTSFNWRPGLDSPEWADRSAIDNYKEQMAALFDTPEKEAWRPHIERLIAHPPTGTINCLAVNEKGEISGTTTTSGLAWKIAGRVGDSPIIGAGLYVDGDVGAAGSTGKGEENIKIAGGHTVVEMMRKGMSPSEACLEALHRVARNYNNDKKKLTKFHLFFYALNKDGVHGSASLWRNTYSGKHASYAVHDGTQARLAECTPYFDEPGGDT
jgi:N4-(beta-N-acetylglucosaminyl)-L-asparaginase